MNIQRLFARRIGGETFGVKSEIYKFEKIKRAKAAVLASRPGVELLDFGVGEPDWMAPAVIREALKAAVDDPANRGYADNGIRQFKLAAAAYMRRFFGVEGLDPDTEICHSIGSKPALAMLPLCFVDPGDAVLTTVPGYPVLATHAKYLGGEVTPVPLRRENRFLPDLAGIDPGLAARAKLFYVNYPNNPTGAVATETFYDELIDFARRHNLVVVQDAAYATLAYGRALSILGRPGGREVALELHSLSKSYSMTGWRLGFVCGNAGLVRAYAEVKDNVDSGQFKAIQVAACAGIADKTEADRIRRHYETRLRRLVATLNAAGFEAEMPGGTFYLYVPAPAGAGDTEFRTAEAACQYLIRELSVSTVPWDDVGRYLRFSATFEARDGDDERVLRELGRRLEAARLRF